MKEENEKIKVYIRLVYHPESQLANIQNIKDRKEKAALKSGFDVDDEIIQSVMNLQSEWANKQIFDLLKKVANNRWMKLIADQQLYIRMMEKVLFFQNDDQFKQANTLSKEADELLDRITKNYNEIFLKEQAVVMYAEKETIKMVTREERLKNASA